VRGTWLCAGADDEVEAGEAKEFVVKVIDED
jgi:hypothetical protein